MVVPVRGGVGEGLRIIEGFDDFDSPILTASADLQTTFPTQLQFKQIQKQYIEYIAEINRN